MDKRSSPYSRDSIRRVKHSRKRTRSWERESLIIKEHRINSIRSRHETSCYKPSYKRCEHEPKHSPNCRREKNSKTTHNIGALDSSNTSEVSVTSERKPKHSHDHKRGKDYETTCNNGALDSGNTSEVSVTILDHNCQNEEEFINADFNDASVEMLLEEYKRIKFALASLEQEEEYEFDIHQSDTNGINTVVPSKSESIDHKHIDETAAYSPHDASYEMDEEAEDASYEMDEEAEDFELIELRRRALASQAKKWNDSLSINRCVTNDAGSSSKNAQSLDKKFSSAYSVARFFDNCETMDMVLSTSDEEFENPSIHVTSLSNYMPWDDIVELGEPNSNEKGSCFDYSNGQGVSNAISVAKSPICVVTSIAAQIPESEIRPISVITTRSSSSSRVKVAPSPNNIVVSTVVQRKNVSNKNEAAKNNSNKFFPSNPFFKQPSLVITLSSDSTDSSDNESGPNDSDSKDKATLASLERLIDATKDEVTLNQVLLESSDVVEYLPGIQQEEYLRLKERLAQLEPKQETVSSKNALFNAYTLLMDKLRTARVEIHKETRFLQRAKTISNERKRAFITSQVEVQRLQSQLDAAIKVKDANEKLMFEANAKLNKIQAVIGKRDKLIHELREKCTKLGKQLFGEEFSSKDLK